jgi:hypothetical protein
MVKGIKRYFVLFFLVVCLVLMANTSGFALMKANDSDSAFVGGGNKESQNFAPDSTSTGSAIKDYLIEGAGYFLDSYSETLAFLKQVEVEELQGVDFAQLKVRVANAILYMEKANVAYINLKNLADSTPYNPEIIALLQTFPYTQHRLDSNLIKSIFKEVQNFLQAGDVRGSYGRMLQDTVDILDVLYTVQTSVNNNQMPDGPSLWTLNQYYSQSLLFGQYMAGVFAEILKTQ